MKQFLQVLVLALGATNASADYAIVVGRDSPVDNLSFGDVRQLFIGSRQFWSPNLRVTLLIHAPGARERQVALQVIYNMTEGQFRQYWISKVFRAEIASGPKVVYSQQTALEMLAAIPGAVALVDSTHVPKNLKIIRIDGLLPGANGYKLPERKQ